MDKKQKFPQQFYKSPFPEINQDDWSFALDMAINNVLAGKLSFEAINVSIEFLQKNTISSIDERQLVRTFQERIDEAIASNEMLKVKPTARDARKKEKTKDVLVPINSPETCQHSWKTFTNWKILFFAFLFGLVTGWAVSFLHGPRYRTERVGLYNRTIFRIDTWTGKSWVYEEFRNREKPEWKPVEEKSK